MRTGSQSLAPLVSEAFLLWMRRCKAPKLHGGRHKRRVKAPHGILERMTHWHGGGDFILETNCHPTPVCRSNAWHKLSSDSPAKSGIDLAYKPINQTHIYRRISETLDQLVEVSEKVGLIYLDKNLFTSNIDLSKEVFWKAFGNFPMEGWNFSR